MSKEKKYGKGRFYKKPRKWTMDEDRFVRENVEDMSASEMAETLGRTASSVKGYCTRNKITTDGSGRLEKGQTPYNKGMKQTDYMSDEAIERTKATRFKTGHTPHNTKFDGAITLRSGSGGRQYLWIRLAEGEWQEYHRYLWECENGPVPEGKIIVFKDGNSMHCHLDNLECITRAEHARRNRNPEKLSRSLEEYWAHHPHPSRDLTDNYVAGMLAGGDKELRDYIVEHQPEVVRVARKNYLLKRKMAKIENN